MTFPSVFRKTFPPEEIREDAEETAFSSLRGNGNFQSSLERVIRFLFSSWVQDWDEEV